MRLKRRLGGLLAAIVLTIAAPGAAPAAEEEGVRTGFVQRVDYAAGYVVIDERRYRLQGKRVQPPPGVSSESEDHVTRPFQTGMIVRYTLAPGEPPAIHEAWAVDR